MQLEDYFEFLDYNYIRVRGHRVGIDLILDEYLHSHKTPEQIAKRFPTLSLEQIYAAILYYLHNKERMDTYLRDIETAYQQALAEQERNPPPVLVRLRQLQAERKRAKEQTPL